MGGGEGGSCEPPVDPPLQVHHNIGSGLDPN